MPAGLPFRHEPGTPHIIGAASLLAALEYIESIGGYPVIQQHEDRLTEHVLERLRDVGDRVRLLGSRDAKHRLDVFSFSFAHAHPHDVAEYLADRGISVRSGHHCAEPLHAALGIGASLRASGYIYNTTEDFDRFFEVLLSYPEL